MISYCSKLKTEAKSLTKVQKLAGTEYYPGAPPAGFGKKYLDEWLKYRENIQNMIKKVNTEISQHEAKNKNEYIKQRIDKIRNNKNSATPSKFFKKTDPESVISNQQLFLSCTKM